MVEATLMLRSQHEPGGCLATVRWPGFTWAALAARAEAEGLQVDAAAGVAVRSWVAAGAPPPKPLPAFLEGAAPSDQVLYTAIFWWLDRPARRARSRS